MDLSSIPKSYGGELDWQWGEVPNLDEPARELLQGIEQPLAEDQTKKRILNGPMLFEGDKIEVLGTEDGKERRMTIPVPERKEQQQQEEDIPTTNGDTTADKPANGDVTDPEPAGIADDNEKTALENINQVSEGQAPTATATA